MTLKHKYSELTIIQVAVGNIITPEMKEELVKDYSLSKEQLPINESLDDVHLQDFLYEVCDNVHAHCSNDCPVYLLNGGKVPMNDDGDGDNCRFFKSGIGMNLYIKSKLQELNLKPHYAESVSIHELAHIASELVSTGVFSDIREAGNLLINNFERFSEPEKSLVIGYTVRYINDDSKSGQLLGYLEGKLTK